MNNKILIGVGMLVIGLIGGYLLVPAQNPGSMMSSNIDKHFIEQMIPHHEGAIEMAGLALERSKNPEVLSLAQGIIEAQTREITQMKSWYGQWFGGVPTQGGHMMHMNGMTGDVEELKTAADFDQEFLSQMIVHHEMAVMMAQMLASATSRSEMKTLAEQIITSQTSEITLMRGWLAQ